MLGGKIYKGDIGTIIIVDVGEDLADATVTLLKVSKPDGALVEWTPEVIEDTKLKYTVVDGDLDIAGVYKIQPYVEKPGWSGRGDTVSFTVYEDYK